MKSRDFAYWLQGFFEMSQAEELNKDQVKILKNHLNLVFHHDIDLQYKPGDASQEVHDGKPAKKSANPHDLVYRC